MPMTTSRTLLQTFVVQVRPKCVVKAEENWQPPMSLDSGGSEILPGFEPIAKSRDGSSLKGPSDSAVDELGGPEFKEFNTSLRHHQMPNFAAILPDYSNREQEYIRQAFSVTSFVMVRDLPTRLRPSATNRAMAAKVDSNRRSVVLAPEESTDKASGKTKNGLFSTFDYVPSRYSLADELKTKERLENEAKRLEIGGRDFVCSGQSKKLKYEDVFENKEYRFPYMVSISPVLSIHMKLYNILTNGSFFSG